MTLLTGCRSSLIIYERGISLNVTSKAYGLPGLRIGWVACQDKAWMLKLERMKQYLSICNSIPGEILTHLALHARAPILERVMQRSRRQLATLTIFWRDTRTFDAQLAESRCAGVCPL